MKYIGQAFLLFLMFIIHVGCSNLPRNPPPLDQIYDAKIPGITGARAWSGRFSNQFEDDLLLSARQSLEFAGRAGSKTIPDTNILSISGGGANGAFGAGFICGWSKTGMRPEFKLVSGISTGALIAPFAFLGPEYDSILEQAYTTVSAKDIFLTRWFSFLWKDAVVDTTPLETLIKRYITTDVLKSIALAHQQGRRLFIGTTNLDADQLVVWNMGVIANSNHPKALELFHKIILASSSVPGAFPPVMIEVEVNGISYDEMHVDGGVKAQMFFLAATLDAERLKKKLARLTKHDQQRNIYVIRNAQVAPELKQVPRNLGEISARTISSLIKTQAMNDLIRIYEITKTHGLGFNWVSIPSEYKPINSNMFDTEEMNRLFKIGYEMGQKNDVWRKGPPENGQL